MSSRSEVSLVTGGSRGIGRAIVEALLERGGRVFFCGRNPEGVAAAQSALEARYPKRIEGRVVDVRDADAVASWVDASARSAGCIDLLVNNAGLGRFAPVDEISIADYREVIETNLLGVFHGIRAVAPIMKHQGRGWIVNIASLAAKNPFAGGAAYNASKFGLVGLSEAAMLDLRPHGVRVAAVLPGSVATELRVGFRSEPQEWMLQPEDVARVVVDLLDFPERALPSLVEIRPTNPPKR